MSRLKIDPSIFAIPNNIAVTGRIKSWLTDLQESVNSQDTNWFTKFINKHFGYKIKELRRLPVSCTVYVVGDSMDEIENSIEHSWLYTSQGLRNGAGVAIHLSKLRPKNTPNGKGLVSSGPVSFAQIYSKLNEILRRGGTFRNGACLTSDNYILTKEGPRQVKELINQKFTAIVNGKEFESSQDGFWCNGFKEVFLVKTKKGYTIKLTEDHPLLKAEKKSNGHNVVNYLTEWTLVKNLTVGMNIALSDHSECCLSWSGKGTYDLGWLAGHFIGNGHFDPDKRATINFYGQNNNLVDYMLELLIKNNFLGKVNQFGGERTPQAVSFICNGKPAKRVSSSSLTLELNKLGIKEQKEIDYESLHKTSSDFQRGFIQGFFDADGTVVCRKSITRWDLKASQAKPEILECIQLMLSRFGIISTVYKDDYFTGKTSTFSDVDYGEKTITQSQLYILSISGKNVKLFYDRIGFSKSDKQAKLEDYVANRKLRREFFIDEIVSIKPLGNELVYDCTIPIAHEFDSNGIRTHNCTLHLDYDHPDIVEFATAPRDILPWARRAINVDENFINHPDLDVLLKSVETGDCFLVKKQYDSNGDRLYHNVCQEILLPHTGTCLISHVNLGALKLEEIVPTFIDGMNWLCRVHGSTGVDLGGYYLSPKKDKQVGLGVLGLANLLAIEGITYEELVRGMEKVLGLSNLPTSEKGYTLAWNLYRAYQESAKIAVEYKMQRCFTVAPTANCSFKYKDREFYVTTPEIAPPVDTSVERDSQTMGVLEVDYHPDCQIASEVGWDVYYRLNKCWQMYMDSTGLGHAISTNWWSDKVQMNKDFVADWLKSPLKSLYYAWQVSPQVQDKSEIISSDDFELEQSEECLPCMMKKQEQENAYNTECSACAE